MQPPSTHSAFTQPASILVIDDDEATRGTMASLLDMEGFDVSVASDGELAMRSVETKLPDLVITDLEMPTVSGFGFIDAFRERFADVPVIVVSGHSATTYRVMGLEMGADDFLPKPVDCAELLARIHTHLRRARRQQEAVRLSQSDELTGMLNRRGIVNFCERTIRRAKDPEESLSVALVDVDDFKSINDRYGHVVGDSALCSVACALQDALRSTDRVGRIGGDEFLVVCPESDAIAIDDIVRRLRARLPVELSLTRRETLDVHASIGWATRHADESLDQLIARADGAMYRDKRS
jgi:diguanylate cyclase (GGDEF)-like protein